MAEAGVQVVPFPPPAAAATLHSMATEGSEPPRERHILKTLCTGAARGRSDSEGIANGLQIVLSSFAAGGGDVAFHGNRGIGALPESVSS